MPCHARCWEKAEVKLLKADITASMSEAEGTAEVDFRERGSRLYPLSEIELGTTVSFNHLCAGALCGWDLSVLLCLIHDTAFQGQIRLANMFGEQRIDWYFCHHLDLGPIALRQILLGGRE